MSKATINRPMGRTAVTSLRALEGTYPTAIDSPIPRIMAPRKVRGRLRKRPTIAAA